MIITLVIIAIFLLCLWHLLCENIIVPTRRTHLRYRLFACRDALRATRARDPRLTKESFEVLQQNINGAIRMLPEMSILTLLSVMGKISLDDEIQKRIQHRQEIVNSVSDLEAVKSIETELSRVWLDAIYINSFGGIYYLYPLYRLVKSIRDIKSYFVSTINMKQLRRLEETEVSQYFPPQKQPAPRVVPIG